MAETNVTTLFVSGLPLDVKPREIYLLFRYFPGYQECSLNFGKQPVAFVVFETQAQALAAKTALDNVNFDPESPVKLRIELAKQNSKRKDEHVPGNSGSLEGTGQSMGLPSVITQLGSSIGVGSLDAAGLYGLQPSMIGSAPDPNAPGLWNTNPGVGPSAGSLSMPAPPCNTLFVANLGPKTTEEELTDLFTRCYGFRRLRVNLKSATPVCFVEFQDTACSTQAMNLLQNFQLASCDRGGMKIEYAKNPMGVPSQKKRLPGQGGDFIDWPR
eukprot:CAMPEP_0184656686 /NCGR_PEP_ID=MMETSP0308-20130426/16656_1 /TAXON_ID=38269 /ORGANISM="Gloeochaete witrockiana, Strain SAG 46.84" /LENGTH=270 /DNA_ID=CAMNT_0027093923 /DNA_START=165 /DNA_END=977 /DNA_ORIENTATION=+